jgi:hypothetical protein
MQFKHSGKAIKTFGVPQTCIFDMEPAPYAKTESPELVTSIGFNLEPEPFGITLQNFGKDPEELVSFQRAHNENKVSLTSLGIAFFEFLGKTSDNTYALLQKGVVSKISTRAAASWAIASIAFYTLFSFFLLARPTTVSVKPQEKYISYSSKPLTIEGSSYGVYARDSRSERINSILKKYNCPMEGLGEVFVYEADKNNIPWWLVASVAFQESGCGKKTPEVNGVESYNAWGWGVYGDNVTMFDNWVRGIETVSKYFNEKFYSKGITNTCDIMKVYTPPSKGSWCNGVNFFGDVIQNYKSPTE